MRQNFFQKAQRKDHPSAFIAPVILRLDRRIQISLPANYNLAPAVKPRDDGSVELDKSFNEAQRENLTAWHKKRMVAYAPIPG